MILWTPIDAKGQPERNRKQIMEKRAYSQSIENHKIDFEKCFFFAAGILFLFWGGWMGLVRSPKEWKAWPAKHIDFVDATGDKWNPFERWCSFCRRTKKDRVCRGKTSAIHSFTPRLKRCNSYFRELRGKVLRNVTTPCPAVAVRKPTRGDQKNWPNKPGPNNDVLLPFLTSWPATAP